ncbi:MAG: MFS transporter [Pseudomonadales bacterium]|nr:MFS transporter [Pseudomonadales bacterium]
MTETPSAKTVLGNRDFRLLLAGTALGQMLGPLQFLTQILWVQANAPENIWLVLVAMIGASRGLGALTFGLYGGALADRYDRRVLLIAAQLLLVTITCAISALMFSGVTGFLGFALFFFLAFLAAGLQAVDAPTRLAIVPDILGPELTPSGMSLAQVAVQLSMPVAMLATGFIIHELGFGGAYLFSVSGHFLVIFFLLLMRYEAATPVEASSSYGFGQALNDVREGLAYARGHNTVLWIIILLVIMMSLGFPATANLGPTWINTEVGVPIKDIGYIVMNWGIGSLVAALFLTRFSKVAHRGRLIAGGAILFSVSFVIFVSDRTVTNVVLGNLGLGAGMTITSVSSTILIQQLVPNEVRGRIMSLFQLNMGFAQLMTMPVAMLAQWLTLSVLFPVLAGVTLIVVLLVIVTQRQIIRG